MSTDRLAAAVARDLAREERRFASDDDPHRVPA